MTQTPDICASCGKPSSSGFQGSLTQWVFLCRCRELDIPDAPSGSTIKICVNCGKRIGGGRSGTFTQWIFRTEICECSDPKPVERSVEGLSGDIQDSTKVITSHLEIEVDKEKFPVERFAPIGVLGSTWDSTIYLSIDRLLGSRVALKLVELHKPEDIVRFQKEVKFLASLSDPGIVKVLDFAEKEGAPYMVMEYIDGPSLRSFLKANAVMSVDDTAHVVKSLCQTLSYCHGKNVLHRDIKPENILVCANTDPVEVKLLDFGLACTYDTVTKQGDTVAGTPLYMAPDVGTGNKYDVRSEVYSLGCVMFELLTGDPPFETDKPLQLLKMHADADIPLLSSWSKELEFDSQLEGIVSKCMAKDPDDRFQTMQELYTAIEEYSRDSKVNEFKIEEDVFDSSTAPVERVALERGKPKQLKVEMLYVVLILLFGVTALGIYLSNLSSSMESPVEKSINGESPFGSDEQLFLNRKTIIGNPLPAQPVGPIVTDKDLKYLASHHKPGMRQFILDSRGGVSVGQLASFFKTMKLETVTFAHDLCEPKYIRTVSNLKTLRVLRLIGPSIDDVESIPRSLSNFHTLALNNSEITSDYIKKLNDHKRLNHLRFNFSVLDDGSIAEISRTSKFRNLSFANCSFWLNDFESLQKRNSTTYIRLKSCIVLKPGMSESLVRKKVRLVKDLDPRNLILSSATDAPELAPELISSLSRINLRRLYLENFIFTREILLKLGRIKKLERIDFRNCMFEIGARSDFAQANPAVEFYENACSTFEPGKYKEN